MVVSSEFLAPKLPQVACHGLRLLCAYLRERLCGGFREITDAYLMRDDGYPVKIRVSQIAINSVVEVSAGVNLRMMTWSLVTIISLRSDFFWLAIRTLT